MPTPKGKKLSRKHRKAISKALKGREITWKDKIGDALRGKPKSAEACVNMSEAKKGKPGHKWTEEEKARASEIHKGRKFSDESREKMSRAKKENPTNYWLGKKRGPMPKPWRDAIAKGNKGKVRSPDYRVAHAKKVEYKGINFRSKYEVRVATALDALGIKWIYEPKRFFFDGFSYLPDFYLPDDDAYWEVKGYYGPESRMKIEAFRKEYPETPLVLVMRPLIEQLEQSVQNTLTNLNK